MQKALTVAVVGLGSVFALASFRSVGAYQASSGQPPARTYPSQSNQQSGSMHMPDINKEGTSNDPMRQKFEEQASKARNTERFKRIQTDTEKLLKLSTELKEDVDKTTKNEMSLDVIRKAAEVEKLARDVKERMKG